MRHTKFYVIAFALCLTAFSLSSCSSVEKEAKYPTGADRDSTGSDIYAERQTIFGEGGLRILGGRDEGAEDNGIGVNKYLWRAALDTASFMPLASADPFGGVILTDWYAPEGKSNERFKLNIFIVSRSLRSDGIEVKLFKQKRSGGKWVDASSSRDSEIQLEDTILTRARQLRVQDLES